MPFEIGPDSRRRTRVECDLDDVLGVPGVAPPTTLVAELDRATGQSWSRLPTDGLFLTSDGAGAFAPTPAAARSAVDVVLPAAGPDRRSVSTLTSGGARHEVVEQRMHGAPVYGATYRLHYAAGSLTITGRPVGDLDRRDPGPWPGGATDRAVRTAMRDALGLPGTARIALERVVFPTEGRGLWAVKGDCVLRDPPVDLRVLLRAEDLALLLSYDVACSSLLGEASVHAVSPSRTPALDPVVLTGIGPEPGDRLRGTGLDVRPSAGRRLVRRNRDFRRGTDRPGYDEVSAYAYLQHAARWFAAVLGPQALDGPPFNPLAVTTGDPTVREAVGMFFPSSGELHLGDGPRPGARSADIVIHEFAHAVADRVCRLNRSPVPAARALSEGYADYAACSALDDPRFGDYVRDDPAGARNCADPALRFPAVITDADRYRVGAVWAASLWDLRTALGATVADTLAGQSLFYLTATSTLDDAVAALRTADRTLFPGRAGRGRHEDVLTGALAARGVS